MLLFQRSSEQDLEAEMKHDILKLSRVSDILELTCNIYREEQAPPPWRPPCCTYMFTTVAQNGQLS